MPLVGLCEKLVKAVERGLKSIEESHDRVHWTTHKKRQVTACSGESRTTDYKAVLNESSLTTESIRAGGPLEQVGEKSCIKRLSRVLYHQFCTCFSSPACVLSKICDQLQKDIAFIDHIKTTVTLQEFQTVLANRSNSEW